MKDPNDSNERLLDMCWGWHENACNEQYPEEEVDIIGELYQAAGKNVMTDDDVKKFLLEKIFPVLCKGK